MCERVSCVVFCVCVLYVVCVCECSVVRCHYRVLGRLTVYSPRKVPLEDVRAVALGWNHGVGVYVCMCVCVCVCVVV